MTDEHARQRILTDLDTSFLVEAGAGSGKTTALVGRLVAHIRRGTPVGMLAAVTFTRKAANELRERFQLGLEADARDPAVTPEARDRLEAALTDLDRAFLGTIHAFCGRLLRERPLDAGIDPGFTELDEQAWPRLVDGYWDRWIAECRERQDPVLATLASLGLEPQAMREAFHEIVDNPDVDFSAPQGPPPDIRPCRSALEQLMDQAESLRPRDEPEGGWDALQRTLRRLWYRRRNADWTGIVGFCGAIEGLPASAFDVTQNRWGTSKGARQAAKELQEAFEGWRAGLCASTLTAWREHRYAPVIGILRRAAGEFAVRRARTGELGFADLLMRAAALLRDHPDARAALGERYRYLLVDEFQDTDPIQAEVCFLLASPPEAGGDWRLVRPRPGALFVVGDPKQSIYRFRRADIGTYNEVRSRLAVVGEVLELTRNFRSTDAIATFVNGWARPVFPEAATPLQAAYAPLQTKRPPQLGIGVHRLTTPPGNRGDVVAESAARIAAWIAGEVRADRRQPGDLLVLTWVNRDIAVVARALAERNLPAVTTGAPLPQEHELRELLLLLRALADPMNPVLVAAVLEGLFFGLTPADLYDARSAGARFILTEMPAPGHPASEALGQLHRWWGQAGTSSPDGFLDRLLDESGLLAWSASQPLGEGRAGALLQLVEATRRRDPGHAGDLPGMVRLLDELLAAEAPDAPLRPGRRDVIRVMNLHKAKGLEAPVVILAAPAPAREIAPERCVRRGADGLARGGFLIRHGENLLAQVPGWAADAAAEARFLEAERERLLYVAATRAREQLVISDCPDQKRASWWAALARGVDARDELEIPAEEPPGRQRLAASSASLATWEETAVAGLQNSRQATWARRAVTRLARETVEDREWYDLPMSSYGDEARAIGRVLHRVIEAAGRGRRGESLRDLAVATARQEGLGVDFERRLTDALEQLLALPAIDAVLSSGRALFELPVVQVREVDGQRMLIEGVLDSAMPTAGGWKVVDWKLGSADREGRADYQQQVTEYARILASLTGRPAEGDVAAVNLP